jgi:hypothetical protein
MPNPKPKQYIGDSVYVEFDGYRLILTTENGYSDDPRNRIVLEPEVFHDLVKFYKQITFDDGTRSQTN